MTERVKPSEIRTGMKITANIWGLSRTVAREVLTVTPGRRTGTVTITVAGHDEPIGISANARIDVEA
jgi:hypothetical protein